MGHKRAKLDKAYAEELNRVVDSVYDLISELGWSLRKVAAKAGLGHNTVWSLAEGHTKLPQHRTVWRLCLAVGLELVARKLAARRAG